MLLAAIICWIVFTLAIGFVQPGAVTCVNWNQTHKHHYIAIPEMEPDAETYAKQDADYDGESYDRRDESRRKREDLGGLPGEDWGTSPGRWRRSTKPSKPKELYPVGVSPHEVLYASNFDREAHSGYIRPANSNMVFTGDDVRKVFFLLLLLVVIGECLSSPAITLADSAVLTSLGEDQDHYGWQRMFGSVGWAVSMFFLGISLDQARGFTDHPCEPFARERNYTICFAVFSVLQGCAFIAATQFRFEYKESAEALSLQQAEKPVEKEYKFSLEGNPCPEPVPEPVKPPQPGDMGKVRGLRGWRRQQRDWLHPRGGATSLVAAPRATSAAANRVAASVTPPIKTFFISGTVCRSCRLRF
ncbi:unnamed protein product [Darwinula stevensoni]|uniref:Major facilitator superfamily associated domain-containing protein n=1 Tax=Darwinula stevensoni TaxID=69355 RepID=A0A7R9A505_9CRUS|nr:unnamed protein product [Darwinula stevensoni]CAG0885388.1 unnamed protein product [Darwinula stevensoni]